MARFTKELRQEIVREFATWHNGLYDPALFLREVRETGESHPAHSWFEWDVEKAASEHQLWQAREFAVGLRVRFEVEEIGRNGTIRVRPVSVPLVHSPAGGRSDGGGYVLTDPDSPEHIAELCRQGAVSLRSWLDRYGGALAKAGGSTKGIEQTLKILESAAPRFAA